MSEFTNRQNSRVKQLLFLFKGIQKRENLKQLVIDNQKVIDNCIPSDVIYVVDALVKQNISMQELKTGINKLLNLLYKTISSYTYNLPKKDSFIWCCLENNKVVDEKLRALKPLIRDINNEGFEERNIDKIKDSFVEIEKFTSYYTIKENVLFPVIEKSFPEFRCLQVMWSFHDDIRQNLKNINKILTQPNFDLKKFNRLVGDVFFNMNAIRFREEKILYPLVEEVIPENTLNSLISDSIEIGFPYFQPSIKTNETEQKIVESGKIDLGTGQLQLEQIKLLFNHLPVDITFVDENNQVAYYSTPKKRIFPRTKAILGRDVHNCHPPESVHVVEKIVEAFKNGEKDIASFWINMKGEKLLIQYYAIRDEEGNYKGVVEVSQEISEIQQLKGEKRLLDWEE